MADSLFTPIRLGDLTLANRIVVSPMCQYSADDGSATEWHLAHLGMLCNSGAGLLVVEATGVEREGRITHGCLGLYSDRNEEALARTISACRRIGRARLGIQLAHAGRKGSSHLPWEGGRGLKASEDRWETIAPSAVAFGADWEIPRQMTRGDMDRVRDAFVAAAGRALRIGFDAIELHYAHGYLLHSFVSPISNRRDDAYGGSLENRMRFPLEVASAVRAAVPRATPLGARITGHDWKEGGLTGDDAVVLARALKEEGLDFVCVSSGAITSDTRTPTGPGYNVALAEQVRREAAIATRAVGLIVTPGQADRIVREGQADMVALARAMLDNPHWAWQAALELGAEIERPLQYARSAPTMWPGAADRVKASS